MFFGLFQTTKLLHVIACSRLLLLKRLLGKVLTSIDELMVAVSVGIFVVATVQVAMVEHMLLSLGLLLGFIVMLLQ